jgi:hypothetical protein
MAVKLTNTKMKDGPDGLTLPLQMVPVSGSLVVSAGTPADQLIAEDLWGTDRKILDTMLETFPQTGATSTELIDVTEIPRSTFFNARGRLLKTPWLKLEKHGSSQRLVLAVDVAPGDVPPWHEEALDE